MTFLLRSFDRIKMTDGLRWTLRPKMRMIYMDKKVKQCVEMLRQLVSDVQGAPYPGEDIDRELYSIWYEHAQSAAVACFEYLDANFPTEQSDVTKKLDKLLK